MASFAAIDAETQRAVGMFLDLVGRRYHFSDALLYGSRARGDAGPDSDADVAIIVENSASRAMDIGTEMSADEFAVMLETGILVQALPIHRAVWDDPSGHSNPYLIANIKREGIML